MIKLKNIKNKRLIKRSLLNKTSTIIMKRINLKMKFILTLSIFTPFITIALRSLTRN